MTHTPPAPSRQQIGRRIASSRRERGRSQKFVAQRAHLDPTYLSRIETGKVHPTVSTALRIAGALGISLDQLVGPTPPEWRGAICPVSPKGACLLDGVHPKVPITTPQQMRLLRRMTAVIQDGDAKLLAALQVLLDGLTPSRG